MKRKSKIAFGVSAIVLVSISTFIGLFLLSGAEKSYSLAVESVLKFFLIIAPTFTILAVLYLLKKDM